jgi:hypothetical protein
MRPRLARLAAGLVLAGAVLAPVAVSSPASAAPCAAVEGSISIVIDFNDGPLSTLCLPPGSADSGASFLVARAESLGKPAPRFNSSGLLCAIDNYPDQTSCGEQTGSQYAYWSYWHGTASGGWVYSEVGPASSPVVSGQVEGWRFQPNGAGNPSDPPPRFSSDPAATCTGDSGSTPTESTPPASEPSPTSPRPAATPSTAAPSTTITEAAASSESTTTSSSSTVPTASSSPRTTAVAAGPVRVTDRDDSGPSLGPLIAGGLLVALGVGGAVIGRRRGARAGP